MYIATGLSLAVFPDYSGSLRHGKQILKYF